MDRSWGAVPGCSGDLSRLCKHASFQPVASRARGAGIPDLCEHTARQPVRNRQLVGGRASWQQFRQDEAREAWQSPAWHQVHPWGRKRPGTFLHQEAAQAPHQRYARQPEGSF